MKKVKLISRLSAYALNSVILFSSSKCIVEDVSEKLNLIKNKDKNKKVCLIEEQINNNRIRSHGSFLCNAHYFFIPHQYLTTTVYSVSGKFSVFFKKAKMASKKWNEIDMSSDELKSISEAFKKEEFRKLFFEYCEELNDPENKKNYEQELIQLESERGVNVKFIHPEPGFVIKTSIDGDTKAFINISKNVNIEMPTSQSGLSEKGQRGLTWSIPHTVAPLRRDLDNKGNMCVVFDVVFHPDTIYLTEKNDRFRKLVIETACDAVEKSNDLIIDRNNLKFPKLAFKGTARPTIIRKKDEKFNDENLEPNPIESIYPPIVEPIVKPIKPKEEGYTTPKYQITHRRDVEYHEFINDKNAKLNTTIPKQLIISIDLPLLNSTQDVTLDVTSQQIYLFSEKPAKYKLTVKLPHEIMENEGSAKFDKSNRKLVITLPVVQKPINVIKFDDKQNNIEEIDDEIKDDKKTPSEKTGFHENSITYNLPPFTCETIDDGVEVTLQVKNIDSSSLEFEKKENKFYVKFACIGSGYYPIHYSFLIYFIPNSSIIANVETDIWDNSCIVKLELTEKCEKYLAGLNDSNLEEYFLNTKEEEYIFDEDPESEAETEPEPEEKKIPAKNRSVSESNTVDSEKPERKIRSLSESCSTNDEHENKFKSILKRKSFISESSMDDHSISGSMDFCGSFDGIPEETGSESDHSKKTVRFNDVIHKQVFRSNSSILGQRKKNQKKKSKKRALDRRFSESENSEGEVCLFNQ